MSARLVTLFGAGVLVSWVVAWSCVLWAPLHRTRPLAETTAKKILTRALDDVHFDDPPTGTRDAGPGWAMMTATLAREDPRAFYDPSTRTGPTSPPGVLFREVPTSGDIRTVSVFRAGWPMPCFGGRTVRRAGEREDAFLVTPPTGLGVKPMRKLPVRPLIAGFAVDALFFGGILWLVGPGRVAAVGTWRRRRGLCAKCGYDLRHSDGGSCPECGPGHGT